MKKMIALVLFAATVFGLAACAKKNESKKVRYEEPPTEVITFSGGGQIVYEVETDKQGEAKTDAEGNKVYRLYDPPVTDKEGYLVTDAEGSTIKRSSTTGAPVTVEHVIDVGDLSDLFDPADDAGKQTDADRQTEENGTVAQTDAEGKTLGTSSGKSGSKTEATTFPVHEHASTVATTGQLTQGKANKMIKILEGIENPFETDLAEDRFNEANESIKVYIANIKKAQEEIKADPDLYVFADKRNFEYWNYYLKQMQIKYGEFVSIYNAQKPGQKPSSSVSSSYVAFQNEYRKAIEVYYHLLDAAEKYAK